MATTLGMSWSIMKILKFVYISLAQSYNNWAMREINPLHKDVPKIIRRQIELREAAENLFSRRK